MSDLAILVAAMGPLAVLFVVFAFAADDVFASRRVARTSSACDRRCVYPPAPHYRRNARIEGRCPYAS